MCFCLNGGVCRDSFVKACVCPPGFIGRRCQDVMMEFVKEDNSDDNLELIVVLSIFLFIFVISLVICFFTWRRSRSKKRREEKMTELRSRRQSKATIEGTTFSGLSKDSESDDSSLKSILIIADNQNSFSAPFPIQLSELKVSKAKTIKEFVACL